MSRVRFLPPLPAYNRFFMQIKFKSQYLLLGGLILCLFVTILLIYFNYFQKATEPESLPPDTINANYIARDISFYTRDASAIIIGTVQTVGDPEVKIDVDEVLKGNFQIGSNVTVFVDKRIVDGVSFIPGEKVLLFLGMDNYWHYVVYAGPSGKYLIEGDRVISFPDFEMSLEDLKNQIKETASFPYEPFIFGRYVARDIPAYTRDASAIIIGTVQSVDGDGIEIEVEEILKGDLQMSKIAVLADEEGGVSFVPGEKVLLFVGTNDAGNYIVYAGLFGKYLIEGTNVSNFPDFETTLEDLKLLVKEAESLPYELANVPFYTRQASIIIIGTVQSVGNPEVEISVNETLKGDLQTNNFTVFVNKNVDGVSFVSGEKVLLFIGTNGEENYVVYAGLFGKYIIDEEGNVISNFSNLKTPLEDFKKLIKDTLEKK